MPTVPQTEQKYILWSTVSCPILNHHYYKHWPIVPYLQDRLTYRTGRYIYCIIWWLRWSTEKKLLKFIVKKVTDTQQLHTQHHKREVKKVFQDALHVKYAPHLLPCTYWNDAPLCQKLTQLSTVTWCSFD